MKKGNFLTRVVFGGMIFLIGLGFNSVSQASNQEIHNSIQKINYYYEADLDLRIHQYGNIEPITLTLNHYVDGFAGEYSLYKQEQYFNLTDDDRYFKPKDYYLDFSWTEWEPDFSHTNLDSDEPFEVSEENSGLVINYYYEADLDLRIHHYGSLEPITFTLNHYVDGFTGEYSLYKQEQYFNLTSDDRYFKPKDYYIDFSWTEWEPEFSHTNLDSDAPFWIN